MNTLHERFKQVRLNSGLKQDDFGEKIGLGRGGASAIERGVQSLSQQSQEGLIRQFNVSMDWLLTGEGAMHLGESEGLLPAVAKYISDLENHTRAQKRDISALQRAYAQVKEIVDSIQKFLFEHHELPIAEIPDLKTSSLLFAERVAAGNPISMTEQENARKIEVAGDYSDKKFFVVQAEGTSMTAAGIDNGDYALISSENGPKDGEIMLIWHDGCGAIKKLTQKGQDWHIVWCDGSGHSEKIADPEWKVLGIYCGKVALIR